MTEPGPPRERPCPDKTGPERQCIGCGLRGPQSEFLRLTLDGGASPRRVVLAGKGARKGRGAYLCRRRSCLDRALHRKAFQRAFRASVEVSKEEIEAALDRRAEERSDRQDG